MTTTSRAPARIYRAAGRRAPIALTLAVAALLATGCGYRYPHACDGHGGIRTAWKGMYFCRDGHKVGGLWLLFHPHDPRSRP